MRNFLGLPLHIFVYIETIRLHPPAGMLTRRCTSPTTLSDYNGKSIKIEKDMIGIIPLWSMQRDAKYYSDPDEFIPERFSAENGGAKKYRDMGVFMPFGDGPRQCLGEILALIV